MQTFEVELNQLLLTTFKDILKVEELILQRSDPNLSLNEVHLIESVRSGEQRSRSVSELAHDLDMTAPSITVAVNKLIKKGYLVKLPDPEDRRSVRIKLTREGEKIFRLHRYFHHRMVRQAAAELTEEEKQTMLIGIRNIDEFFKKKVAKYGGLDEFSNHRHRTGTSGVRANK